MGKMKFAWQVCMKSLFPTLFSICFPISFNPTEYTFPQFLGSENYTFPFFALTERCSPRHKSASVQTK